jgi:hypothetical protein
VVLPLAIPVKPGLVLAEDELFTTVKSYASITPDTTKVPLKLAACTWEILTDSPTVIPSGVVPVENVAVLPAALAAVIAIELPLPTCMMARSPGL